MNETPNISSASMSSTHFSCSGVIFDVPHFPVPESLFKRLIFERSKWKFKVCFMFKNRPAIETMAPELEKNAGIQKCISTKNEPITDIQQNNVDRERSKRINAKLEKRSRRILLLFVIFFLHSTPNVGLRYRSAQPTKL